MVRAPAETCAGQAARKFTASSLQLKRIAIEVEPPTMSYIKPTLFACHRHILSTRLVSFFFNCSLIIVFAHSTIILMFFVESFVEI